ncbi:3-isopropylmalate dehydratase [Cupriavidus sp. SZY C1]|uniref:LeuD/DmdB family oxidoreductase small subunit n=1 Tax=Cupriavidus sp. SZY C1 TaxID=3055037 RepID=UPI0028BBF989|nr:3-isopropylmalate dehydratase [Cupriavidus sp. SZY C1]MDT6963125.1 3-isopropylmalate dehydratase [Cupriavidus sp. SZY C1]
MSAVPISIAADGRLTGRAWVFGDDINTDLLAPGAYMKFGIEEIARHCLEAVEPLFATQVRPGDIVFGGRNFGAGSSREQAVEVLRHLGVVAVVAPSFAGLFYRNGFNLGLPLLTSPALPPMVAGQRVGCDIDTGQVFRDGAPAIQCEPVPPHLVAMIRDGGLVPHLARRIASGQLTMNKDRQ